MFSRITPTLLSVGVNDTSIDLFESQYPVPEGITYNSYIIDCASPVVMDSVDASFTEEWLDNIDEALQGRKPGRLVALHLEPDHSGSIVAAMEKYPALQLIVSAKAKQMLPCFFPEAAGWGDRITAVADGNSIEITPGNELRFIMAPMVHWPEVMVAYLTESRTLFSADAFGTFGTAENVGEWTPEAARYYFNICGKYGVAVQTLLKKAATLEIDRICPLHGPVLDRDLSEYIALYDTWSRYEPDLDSTLIAYASIYGNTASAAVRLAIELEERGHQATVVDLARADISEVVSLAFRHKRIVLASATYNGDIFPPMSVLLHHLSQKGWRNHRVGLIQNGSWSPTAARVMKKILETMKDTTIVEPIVTVKTTLSQSSLKEISALADAIARPQDA